jgi:phosphate transport system substrate-binding protein
MKILFKLSICLLLLQNCTCLKDPNIIKIDGSSTMCVLSEAIAEDYQKEKPNIKISVGACGTGGGFKKLCDHRVNIIGASRKISISEENNCKNNNIELTQFKIAYDGIVIVVNKENHWLNEIRFSELKKIFEPASENIIKKWNDVNPFWPSENLQLYAPGIASGTYDYFTKVIVKEEHASRGDITTSEDDNVLVHAIKSNKNALGFFSFAYYEENKKDLKVLKLIDDTTHTDNESILPEITSIKNSTYPLSRAIYIYANQGSLNKESLEFLKFYLNHSSKIALEVGFVPLTQKDQIESLAKIKYEK